MKLIHLSDLHLGKRVNEVSMIEDQEYILKQILAVIDAEKADAVLISGDIYDKSVPSAEAVTLCDDFLFRLSERKLPVFLISGNHDSSERLSFGSRLLKQGGIYISPVYNGEVSPITLYDEFGSVNFWLLPFIKPAHVKRFFPEETVNSYTDACRIAIEQMNIDRSARNVLLTHQFVTGAMTCESEEITVGGSDNVDASVFEDFDYVALGHIHGPQNISSNRIRYCGTPLKYSFSEASHHKSVTVAELSEKGALQLWLRPLTPKRDLRELRGSFSSFSDPAFYKNENTEDYLHIILTDEEDVPEAVGKLRVIYPNLLKLSYDNTRTRTSSIIETADNVQRKTELQLFEELFEQQNNQPMSDEQRNYLQDLIHALREEKQ